MIEAPLTSEGQQRRKAILRLMQETARRKRRRRQIVRTTAACAVAVIMLSLVIHWRPRNGGGGGTVRAPVDYATTKLVPIEPPIKPVSVVIGRIATDPTILERWSLSPQVKTEQATLPTIDDDDLIRTLADAGQSAGLIQVGGETTLVTSSTAQ
jgi:hypothetical protein